MKPTMYFRFEKFYCKNNPSIRDLVNLDRSFIGNFLQEHPAGFRFSQVVDTILEYYKINSDAEETIKFLPIDDTDQTGYIIPIAVCYHPNDWTDMTDGIYDKSKTSIFEEIHPRYLKDMQNGRALLLIDQSVEGYSTTWLWPWFHEKLQQYNLNPECIIYLTGDQSCEDTYNIWCQDNNIKHKIKTIPSISLSMYINKKANNIKVNFDDIIMYKTKNTNSLYLYDCTNMRPRPQRVLAYLHLINSNLINKGNISMAAPSEWYMDITALDYLEKYNLPKDLPLKVDLHAPAKLANYFGDIEINKSDHYYRYVERILNKMYENSWLSVITESSYFDYEYNVFISEKTFKPIACMQPFIIVGSKNTLFYLKKLGYKTFAPWINEDYDTLNDSERFVAIITELKRIDAIEDKVTWYNGMKEILEYNYN